MKPIMGECAAFLVSSLSATFRLVRNSLSQRYRYASIYHPAALTKIIAVAQILPKAPAR